MKKSNQRRSFLKAALFSGLGIGTLTEIEAKEKPVKMLDPEGNLVELDPSILKKSKKKKATNQDILSWAKSIIR